MDRYRPAGGSLAPDRRLFDHPVVVNGVAYTQDIESNVMAIKLASGKVLWAHNYSSPNGAPDGVNVANGVVYAATSHAAAGGGLALAVAPTLAPATVPIVSPVRAIWQVATCAVCS
jgi:outer membrane protein assembly factor BamB